MTDTQCQHPHVCFCGKYKNAIPDRSPRTPPALSNATPPLCDECGKPLDSDNHIKYGNDLDNPRKHTFMAAAPPVVEGPRPQDGICDCASGVHFEGNKHYSRDDPRTWEPWQRTNIDPFRDGGTEEHPNMKPIPAAAPSDDFVARLYKINDWHWKDKHTQEVFGLHGLLERYAADLQRQLDNWKANARTAREYWRSAEAANQELRRALGMLYNKWENGDPCYEDADENAGFMGNAFRLSAQEEDEVLALLGPQHGDTK